MNTFPSKRDSWLTLIVVFAIVAMASAGVSTLWSPSPMGFNILISLALIVGAGFTAWIFFGISYTIAPPDLRITAGPFRFRVPLDRIIKVYPTRNPLSSPAASLDRLRIDYRTERGRETFVMISPPDKQAFLRVLSTYVSGLEVEGEQAERPIGGTR
jgi:hypothetical protein